MMATLSAPATVAGYKAGRWKIDPTHSQVSFSMRHTLVRLRGCFVGVSGIIVTADDLLSSHVDVEIDPASFWTGSRLRDDKIRTLPDFLNASVWPTIAFRSGAIEPAGDERNFRLHGLLVCRGIERPVVLDAVFNGFGRCDLYGLRMGFSATTKLDRRDFGIDTSPPPITSTLPLDEGPSMLGWTVSVEIQVEAVLEK